LGANYATYAKEGYGGNPYVYACIREIATAIGGIPWLVKRQDNDPSQPDEQIYKHPLVDLIKKPNPRQGWSSFIARAITELYLSGDAFIHAVSVGNGNKVTELRTLRPDRVTPILITKEDGLEGMAYEYRLNGKLVATYDETEVLQLLFWNPLDDLRGLSPMTAAAMSIDMNNEGRKWNQSLLKNQARPSGMLSMKGDVGDDTKVALREWMDKNFAGYLNAGKPMISDNDTTWVNLGYSPTEMDWLSGLDLSAREICAAFNVPEELVGGPRKTYENYNAARKSLYTETVLPLDDMLVDALNNWLVPQFANSDSLYLGYDDSTIEALAEETDKIFARANESTMLSVDERREMVGQKPLGPTGNGDVILVPSTVQPLDLIAGQPGGKE